ncbi:MAG: gas vesicle protein GvpO, partial [Candidatus Methylomirabilales bacterium]
TLMAKAALSVGDLVEYARNELERLVGLELQSTLKAVRDERGWLVSAEMIEKHSIPDGMDILATYDILMSDEGEVLEFTRKKLRKRIDTEGVEEE